jgi:hypothetical protein
MTGVPRPLDCDGVGVGGAEDELGCDVAELATDGVPPAWWERELARGA